MIGVNLNRDDIKTFLVAGILYALVAIIGASVAFAADFPCPPKRYYCWEVKLAISYFGEPAVVGKARQCGWPEWKINEARRCLK